MGVPKFYRWISERYPKINEIISDSALLPEFDHLYLDMNGIIHGCSHPADRDISDVVSDRDMMLGIMHYLDRIIQIVKPKVSLYMAIDGVAPRAKLNQQRSRRFRSAKDMAEATREKGIDGSDGQPGVQVFDSNCITPGTEFMARVSEIIKYFIQKKLKEDPQWKNLNVIFSGHEIPGEGEHKIMEHIRRMKNQPGYRPNTRHCMYGQDADLIMLGLVTHEPHFTLLREIVDFGFGKRRNDNALKQVKKFTEESHFQLLHLSVLREYLFIEFCKGFDKVSLEHSIDDFVFITFLVGNDFLPHLNTLDISEGAFDLLFEVYKQQRSGWGDGQYLTNSGDVVDPARLEAFLQKIGEVETDTLEEREKNDAAYVKKKRRWDKRDGKKSTILSDDQMAEAEEGKQTEFEAMLRSILSQEGATFVDGWKPVEAGEKDFKGRYYFEKLAIKPTDIEAHHALRKSYIEGLMWCMAYYYKGCISWGWYFPYHYGPMLSDLRNLPQMFETIKFEHGAPLTPFQQLMACLPPASSSLVPKLYRSLMMDPQSPIIQFYPKTFQVDMNGKKNPWEGVNLLPFIDGNLLKSTIEKYCPKDKLSAAENKRNRVGDVYSYVRDLTCTDTIPSPNKKIGLVDIVKCHSRVSVIMEPDDTSISFRPELIPGTQIPFPGFPSLNVLPIVNTELEPIRVNCFGMPSKYPNTLLTLHEMPALPPVEVLAENVLGKSLFVNWPMMHEGRVVSVSDRTCEVTLAKKKGKSKGKGNSKHKVQRFDKKQQDTWIKEAEGMREGYKTGLGIPGTGGVEIGEVKIRIKVNPLQGMKSNLSDGSTKKVFGKELADVPLQLALWQAPAPDPRFIQRGPLQIADRFPTDSKVVLTKGKYRGCSGSIAGVADANKVAVKVQVMPPEVPFGHALARSIFESYISSADAARILKLAPSLFGRITSNLNFEPGQYDLGLNLKSSDGMCVAGYTRQRVEKPKGKSNQAKSVWETGDTVLVVGSSRARKGGDGYSDTKERIIWEYTPKAIRLVNEYRQQFPQLFHVLANFPNEKRYDAKRIFGPNGSEWLPMIRKWLNNVESAKLPRTPISTEMMPQDAVAAVEKAAQVRNIALKKKGFPTDSLIKIPPSALYLENSTEATDVILAGDFNNDEKPRLGDRIVNLCATGIPFGARGTVITIHEAKTGCVEVVMDEEFVGGTSLQGHCSNFRGKLCMWAHLLRISADGSGDVVDKLVAKGAGKAAMNNLLSKIEADSNTHAETAPNRSTTPTPSGGSSRASSRNRANPGSRAGSRSRAQSDSRSKQAGWKEAQGPPPKGIGFKGARKVGKSGIANWRKLMEQKAGEVAKTTPVPKKVAPSATAAAPTAPTPAAAATDKNKANQLKAMLGLGGGAGKANPTPAAAPAAAATVPAALSSAEGLKAMLGVGNSHAVPMPPAPPPAGAGAGAVENDASAGLKSLLGVTSGGAASAPSGGGDAGFPPPPPPPPPPQASTLPLPVPMHMAIPHMMPGMVPGMQAPPVMHQNGQGPPQHPKTAADQVLRMMSNKRHDQGPANASPSSFNFTYTEEGKEAPMPPAGPPQQQLPHPGPHGMMYPMMPHMGMMPFVAGPSGPVPMQPMVMGHPGMQQMPMGMPVPGAVFGVPLPPGAHPNGGGPPAQPGPAAPPQAEKQPGNEEGK